MCHDNDDEIDGKSKDARLICCFFVDNVVLLASFESGLQRALNDFSATCDIIEIKINTFKTKVLSYLKISI